MRLRLAVTDSRRTLFPCLSCCARLSHPGFCSHIDSVVRSSNVSALKTGRAQRLNSRSSCAFVLCEYKRNDHTRTSEPPQSPSVILVPLPVFFLSADVCARRL